MANSKVLTDERLAEIRKALDPICVHEYEDEAIYCDRCMLREVLPYADALHAKLQVATEALEKIEAFDAPHTVDKAFDYCEEVSAIVFYAKRELAAIKQPEVR